MRKKVLLYNPEAVFYDMPLALLSIGSALDPDQYEVCILDARVEKDILQKFYNKAAFGNIPWYASPLQWVARQRMNHDYFEYPLEKFMVEHLMPRRQLS